MRIGILGAGGVGSVVAAHLAQAPANEVVLVARADHYNAIRDHGLRVTGAADLLARPAVIPDAADLPPVNLLLLITKTYDSVAALERVDPAKVAMAASLQNGVLKDELLARHFGTDRVIGCATMLGGLRTAPGEVRCTLLGSTFFGELDGTMTPRLAAIGKAFSAGGLPVHLSPAIRSIEWTKQVLQAATATLCTLTRLPLHALYLGPAAALYREIILEAAAVPAALGIPLDRDQPWGGPITELLGCDREQGLALIHARGEALLAASAGNVRISMEQDASAGRRTELEETAGWVAGEAHRLGLPTPNLDFAVTAVRALTRSRP